jgi:hypothetical protein
MTPGMIVDTMVEPRLFVNVVRSMVAVVVVIPTAVTVLVAKAPTVVTLVVKVLPAESVVVIGMTTGPIGNGAAVLAARRALISKSLSISIIPYNRFVCLT